jgi:hypothetical protein
MLITNMRDQIISTLGILINTRLTSINRALDMELFNFKPVKNSNEIESNDNSGIEYTIHAQCAWRITGPEGILVGSQDRFYPGGSDPFHDLEEFDPYGPIINRCDERIACFLKNNSDRGLVVLGIEADNVGSLSLKLNENFSIDLLPANSLPSEHWRFFTRGNTDWHFVVTPEGIIDG